MGKTTVWTNIGDVTLPISGGASPQIDGALGQNTPAVATVSQLQLDTGTKTAAATAGAATLNKNAGVITSEALTTAAGATYTLTLTNSDITGTEQVFASVQLGTATTGMPAVATVTPSAGQVVIVIQNIHATAALNGTIKIAFARLANEATMPIEATIKTSGALGAKLAQMAAGLSSASELRVGFLSSATYPDGTPVALVAAVQNYGSGKTPPRPFFDRMVQENEAGWPELIAIGLKRFDNDAKKALDFAGKIMEEQLQASIVDGQYAPNAPVTNLLKQRFPAGDYEFKDFLKAVEDVAAGADAPAGKPLVWSGHLQSSVGSEVT